MNFCTGSQAKTSPGIFNADSHYPNTKWGERIGREKRIARQKGLLFLTAPGRFGVNDSRGRWRPSLFLLTACGPQGDEVLLCPLPCPEAGAGVGFIKPSLSDGCSLALLSEPGWT